MKKLILIICTFFLFTGCEPEKKEPIYDYYKNLPLIRGWTRDEPQRNFTIDVVLVYRENNPVVRGMVINLKEQFIDALRLYFTSLKEENFSLENQPQLKRGAVNAVNEVILRGMSKKEADAYRSKSTLEEMDLILDVNFSKLQIFVLD